MSKKLVLRNEKESSQHEATIHGALRRVFDRLCEMAAHNSNELVEAVCAEEKDQ